MSVTDLVQAAREDTKQKKTIEEFVIDNAIKDHLN